MHTRRSLVLGWLSLGALAWTATGCCTKQPDLDGLPGRAGSLRIDAWQAEKLHCRESRCQAGDCADWYRVPVESRGELHVDVVAVDDAALVVKLANASGDPLQEESEHDGGRRELRRSVEPGDYRVGVGSATDGPAPLGYEIRVRFVPEPPAPPPPEAPRFESVTSQVLEIEGSPQPRAVLIDRGRTDRIEPGQRGRLLDLEGRVLATVEILDAYQDGSRARIDGALEGPITPSTRVEIDVPVPPSP